MFRNFFRILILGFWVFLLFFWLTHKLEWLGLLVISLVLFLFYLATYVTTLEQNNERISGDGIPTNFEELKRVFSNNVFFMTDIKGRRVFYPWGVLGNGYALIDPSKEQEIRSFIMPYSGITGAIPFLVILVGGGNPIVWLFLFLFLPIDFLWYRIKIAKLIQGLEIINIGSEYYAPPIINKRYKGLFLTILAVGVIGGIGNIYNKGFSINDFLLAAGSMVLLVLSVYISWSRK